MKNTKDLTTSRQLTRRYCFTCGKLLERHRYRCTVCGEMSCSRQCVQRHLEIMEPLNASLDGDLGREPW